MNLRARWIGPPPRVGDYLSRVSTTRARTKAARQPLGVEHTTVSEACPRCTYRVDAVTATDRSVRWDPIAKAEVRRLQIVVARVASTAVSPHSRIHPWKWDRSEAPSKGGSL